MHAPGLGIATVRRASVFIITRRRPANGITIVIITTRHACSPTHFYSASIIVIVAESKGIFVDTCAGRRITGVVGAFFLIVTALLKMDAAA